MTEAELAGIAALAIEHDLCIIADEVYEKLVFDGARHLSIAALGPEKNGGPKLYCVSGHVQKPGVYEASMKVKLRQLIYDYAGGIRDGRPLKAVIPGGSSVPILLPDQLDIEASFDGVAKAGSLLGSAGLSVVLHAPCPVTVVPADTVVEQPMVQAVGAVAAS